MSNKLITTVEIKNKCLLVNTSRMIGDTPISIFNHVETVETSLLDKNDLIIDSNAVKKYLNKILQRMHEVVGEDGVHEMICIVPSGSYHKKTSKKTVEVTPTLKTNLFDLQALEKHRITIEKNHRMNDKNEVIHFAFNDESFDRKPFASINNNQSYKVTLSYEFETIDKSVYRSHINLVKSFGYEISAVIPTFKALYALRDNKFVKPANAIIIDWSNDRIEFAYFHKENIKEYYTTNVGFDAIIDKTADKLHLDAKLCRKYLLTNMDFNSRNALEHFVLKFKNPNYHEAFNGKQIRKIFLHEIDQLIQQGLTSLNRATNMNLNTLPIYHYGVVTTIPSIQKIFRNKISVMNHFVQIDLVGIMHNVLFASGVGVLHYMQNHLQSHSQLLHQPFEHSLDNLEFDVLPMEFKNGFGQALFLKQDGIILDKVKSRKGK